MRAPCFALVVLSLSSVLAGPARAHHDSPGSLLLFHEFDSRPGQVTLLTVTNTHPTESIRYEIKYISESCLEFNRTRVLTPNDTITVLTSFDNPEPTRGFAYVFARSAETGQAVTFDHLVGSAIHVSGFRSFDYGYNAMSYEGGTDVGQPTDLDSDGVRDLDGLEYEQSADELLFPRFVGQGMGFDHSLVLVGLTGAQFQTVVNILAYNDNEEAFSAQYQFGCWAKVRLADVSSLFTQTFLKFTNHHPSEIFGLPDVESGWFRMDGAIAFSSETTVASPAFAAMLVESSRGNSIFGSVFSFYLGALSETASMPFYQGRQGNGDLLPFGALGDR